MKIRSWLPAVGLVLILSACGSSGSGTGTSTPDRGASGGSSAPAKGVESVSASPSAPGASAPSGSAIASPGGDFSVVLPSGWRADAAVAQKVGAVTAYLGPERDSFASNVNVVRETPPAGYDLEQYRTKSLAGLRAAIPITDLSPETTLTVDGDRALEYSFRDTQQGRTLMQRQTVVLHDGQAYTITYTSTVADFAASSDAAHSIVASWRWGS